MADEEKPAAPPCAFGIEISTSRQRCAVGKAYRDSGEVQFSMPTNADGTFQVPEARRIGKVTVEVVFYDSPSRAAAFVAERWLADDPVAVALDPKSQSATLVRPLAEAGVLVTRLSAEDVAVAHGEFTDLVAAGGLRHLNQEELTAAVRGAQQRALAGAQAWERRVAADQAPLNACTFAAHQLLRYEELASPGVWTI